MNSYTRVGVIIGIALLTSLGSTLIQQVYAAIEDGAQLRTTTQTFEKRKAAAPIATSGENNVYIAWWSNKTGNDEVMFKASTDGGKTFSDKMNLSNSTNSESQDAQIAAAGNNVYVTWWERNQTTNEPVMRVSNDNGKTFGEKIMLSSK
jgi:type II secretory pathway pseudopilin PulG